MSEATILVTGAAGFIGSNFVRMLASRSEAVKLIAFDKLSYSGNLANIAEYVDGRRVVFVRGDICDAEAVGRTWAEHGVTHVVNFAAESHVDRSILSCEPFVQSNVVGVQVLLDVARARGVQRFLQISTDEVYGSLPENRPELKFTEDSPLAPNSPYAATKASADCLVRSYQHTYGLPAIITRSSNNYGPYQFPEKLIPLFVTNLMEGRKVPLYGDGMNVRDWVHVEDHCAAVWAVLQRGRAGEVYNIGGNNELTNRALTEMVLRAMGREWEQSVEYVKDRPGHDRRYAIDASKIERELGWRPRWRFEEGIAVTVRWYRESEMWWRAIKSGDYARYYERMYTGR